MRSDGRASVGEIDHGLSGFLSLFPGKGSGRSAVVVKGHGRRVHLRNVFAQPGLRFFVIAVFMHIIVRRIAHLFRRQRRTYGRFFRGRRRRSFARLAGGVRRRGYGRCRRLGRRQRRLRRRRFRRRHRRLPGGAFRRRSRRVFARTYACALGGRRRNAGRLSAGAGGNHGQNYGKQNCRKKA